MSMVKGISLSEGAYITLKKMKKEGMSFSDVIMEHFGSQYKEKNESLEDLLIWIKGLKISGKKEKISTTLDETVYGVKK